MLAGYLCLVIACHEGNYIFARRVLEEVFTPFNFLGKNAFDVVSLAGIQ